MSDRLDQLAERLKAAGWDVSPSYSGGKTFSHLVDGCFDTDEDYGDRHYIEVRSDGGVSLESVEITPNLWPALDIIRAWQSPAIAPAPRQQKLDLACPCDECDGSCEAYEEITRRRWEPNAPAPRPDEVTITDAMVEAAAAAFWASDTMMGQTQSDWDDVTPRWREMVRRDARAILQAALAAAAAHDREAGVTE